MPSKRLDILNPEKMQEFLNHVRGGMAVMKAAEKVKVSHQTLYNRRRENEEFAEQWEAALVESDKITVARLEQEADRRAIEGYEKPIYQGGELVGSEQRYSDTLLMFRLNGLASDKYRQRTEHTVQGEININVTEMYREAAKAADELRAKTEHKRLNGKGNGRANGNGHARTG